MTLKALREQRAKLISDARAILDTADGEKRGLTSDEVSAQTKMLDDAKAVAAQIRNQEALETEERDLDASLPESQRQRQEERAESRDGRDEKAQTRAYERALNRYTRFGYMQLERSEQQILQTGRVEDRGMNTLSGASGGFGIAPDTSFYGRVIEAEKFFGPMNRPEGIATVLNTSTGADLPIATDDDTANMGVIVGEEASHAGGTDPVLAQKILKAYLFSTKIVKVSWQLLQDESFDVEAYLGRKFGQRLGRKKNAVFTTGTGASQPQGFQFAAPTGRTSPNGQSLVTATSFDELKRLKHSVDIAYRQGAIWQFNDETFLAISMLKDGQSRYLLTDSVREGDPPILLGHRVEVNNDMPTMAASTKSIAFGQFSSYYVRNVRGVTIVRLNELYAENGQVGFMAFERSDGALIDAGQGPIKVLVQAAS
jgi:HK97 family phage major capsid protein